MNIKDWPCWAKIGLAAGLAVFILNWPSSSAEWAAWVQAFGSLGAIGAAVFIMNKQRRSLIELEGESRRKSLLYMIRMVDVADDMIDGIRRNEQTDSTNYKENLKNILKWMERIDPLERDLDGVALSFLGVQLEVRKTIDEFDFQKVKNENKKRAELKLLFSQVQFETFREDAQEFSDQEGLGIDVKIRGYPKSHMGTELTITEEEP